MKKQLYIFLIILFTVLTTSNGQNVNQLNKHFIGKHFSIIKDQNRSFDFDSVTTIRSVMEFGDLTNVICFHDTIIAIILVNDLKLYDQPSRIEEIITDSIKIQEFKNYFHTQYQTEPDLNSIPLSIIDFGIRIGFACGEAGRATKTGKKIMQMRKDSVDSATIKKMLLSLNPLDRVIGFFVYDEALHLDCKSLFESLLMQNTYRYRFCRGIAIWFGIGLLLIISSIPWKFLGLLSRPYFRTF